MLLLLLLQIKRNKLQPCYKPSVQVRRSELLDIKDVNDDLNKRSIFFDRGHGLGRCGRFSGNVKLVILWQN